MADKIKNFFAKRKADKRFKQAGPGRRLTDDQSSQSPRSSASFTPSARSQPSEETQLAARAALMRLNDKQRSHDPTFNTSLSAIRAQVRRELEQQQQQQQTTPPIPISSSSTSSAPDTSSSPPPISPHLAVTGVYFRCPFISEEVLSKEEWKVRVREFLHEQAASEPGLTACLMVHSCNAGREKVEACVDTLCKYLDNIVAHPQDVKYRKIRTTNRIFREKVQGMEGSSELLYAAGFREQTVLVEDTGVEEKFLVFEDENIESLESLALLADGLRSAEPIPLELDRNMQVLLPSQAASRTDLPPAFFSISPEEIKREQQLRAEVAEKSLMLRTKAMREKDEMKDLRKYKFSLVRIRFPDGILLQGTFSIYDKLNEVRSFVNENLEHADLPFVLISPAGSKLSSEDDDKTLVDLKLVPAAMLTFSWDASIIDDINSSNQRDVYLKPEVMLLVKQE